MEQDYNRGTGICTSSAKALQADDAVREQLREAVRGAVNRRRNALVYMLARRLVTFAASANQRDFPAVQSASSDWTRVESLSQLRAVVGGRFQKLKEKWIGAGLPLREHRGDRTKSAALDFDGWVELAAWISRQGFEVRLAAEGEPFLFEIRPAETAAGK